MADATLPSDLPPSLAQLWGTNVARARAAAKLSQAVLADRCGVAQQTISKIEHGRMVPLDRLKVRLASELGTSPAAIFSWPTAPGRSSRRGASRTTG